MAKKPPSDKKIREKVHARRELAKESRKVGDLRTARNQDLSRHNAKTEQDIKDLIEKGIPEATDEGDPREYLPGVPVSDGKVRPVKVPLKRIGLRADADPDIQYFPDDETDDIVRFVVHPDIKALLKIKGNKVSDIVSSEKDIFLGLDHDNILTVEINLSHDIETIISVLKKKIHELDYKSSEGINLNKAAEYLKAYLDRRKGLEPEGSINESTETKQIRQAMRLIFGDELEEGQRVKTRFDKLELKIVDCRECETYSTCKKLCPEKEAYVRAEKVSQKERLHDKNIDRGEDTTLKRIEGVWRSRSTDKPEEDPE